MTAKARIAVALAMACGLSACGTGPGLTGNSTGGIFPWNPENQANARAYAEEHCGAYGKVPEISRIYARPGEYISFTCHFANDGPSFRYSH
jgi:hypothetical protein